VLAVQLAFLLLVAALTALAGVLILDLPLWTLGALAGAIAVTFRIAVPIVLHFVPVPALDWQAIPMPVEEDQGDKEGNQEGRPVRRRGPVRRRRRVGR